MNILHDTITDALPLASQSTMKQRALDALRALARTNEGFDSARELFGRLELDYEGKMELEPNGDIQELDESNLPTESEFESEQLADLEDSDIRVILLAEIWSAMLDAASPTSHPDLARRGALETDQAIVVRVHQAPETNPDLYETIIAEARDVIGQRHLVFAVDYYMALPERFVEVVA